MLDAHKMRVFLLVSDTLSFTETARRLHMSQPSVSQHIQSLEKMFETPLFIRKGRNIELTDDGKALKPLAREFVNLSTQIQETMNSLKGEIHGHLVVGCSTTPGKYVLPPLLAGFHKMYPRVQVTCQVTGEGESIKALCDGDTQVALTSSLHHLKYKHAEFHRFMSEPIVLIVPKDHQWAERGEIEASELLEESYIMREPSSGTYQSVEQALSRAGLYISELSTLLVLGNSEAIALAVEENLGVGFVSKMVVKNMGLERVAIVKVRGFEFSQEIYIGFQRRHPSSATQIAFEHYIRKMDNPSNSSVSVTMEETVPAGV
jgi:DNA-binding transcriptional LysR family regulator